MTLDHRCANRDNRRSRTLHIAALFGSIFWLAPAAQPAEIEGVTFPEQILVADDPPRELRLHGMGLLRYRVVFRGYVAALYLPDGVSRESALEGAPRRLELSYFWAIDGADFGNAADELLERALEPNQLASLRPRLDALHAAYRGVLPDDRYSLTYLPGVGTELRLNDKLLATIPGEDFARAYFGIWLGNQPLDAGLRDALLQER
jgi:hypothetical protein